MPRSPRPALLALAALLFLAAGTAVAEKPKTKAEKEAELARLRAEVAAMTERVDDLEYRQAVNTAKRSGQLKENNHSKVAGGAVVGGALGLVGGALSGNPLIGLGIGAGAGAGAGYLAQEHEKSRK